MKGIVNVLKPTGMTSFDIIAICRRIFGIKKIGHAGTLDPGASGVLTVCLGRATKVVPFLTETKKKYRAEITFGVETTTLDAFGEVTNKVEDFEIREEDLLEVLEGFQGDIEQIPPMYSAIKYKGKPLYKLARQGKKIKRNPRKVRIFSLDLLQFNGNKALVDVECSKGTYIRTLCSDIGKSLGVGAYMSFLVRTQVGEFSLEKSLTLEELEQLSKEDRIEEAISNLDKGLFHLPAIKVKSAYDIPLTHGVFIKEEGVEDDIDADLVDGKTFRIYNSKEEFIAVYSWSEKKMLFKPERVFV
ncbi:tRNA pseudouridine(55) synthase TruB [Halonatronum saccharophilum]|uniref:tRNA pseudouridine(55) synthase TruB n=1 Tax=Halonatronum saccharophilum TaxID=150060 RepID=UPI0004897FB2|nr:tRNA pseudouridine(55) synthase TruB [Halonatronum saccharophilum]